MTNYYLHLGYDWNSYRIGSVWGIAQSDDYYLQYALTRNNGSPWDAALFRFQPEDTLQFLVWDLSDPPPNASNPVVVVNIGINTLGGQRYDLSNDPVLDLGALQWGDFDDDGKSTAKSCIKFYPGVAPTTAESPWGKASHGCSPSPPMKIKNPPRPSFPFKMSFFVKVSYTINQAGGSSGPWRVFVGDPETVIGGGRQ